MSMVYLYDADTRKCVYRGLNANGNSDIPFLDVADAEAAIGVFFPAIAISATNDEKRIYGAGACTWNTAIGRLISSTISPTILAPLWQPPQVKRRLPEYVDKATAALVYSAIPEYRNSDRCPAKIAGNYPGECGRTMNFVQAALVCPEHGPVPVRGR